MSMNPFAKPAETMTEEEVRTLAASSRRLREAEAEEVRLDEERKARGEEEAREKAEHEKQARIDAATREHAAISDDVARVVAALGAALVGAACALDKRDAAIREAWALQAELKTLGARPVPSVSVVFAPEAVTAARRLTRLVDYELVLNPLGSAFGSHPEVFK